METIVDKIPEILHSSFSVHGPTSRVFPRFAAGTTSPNLNRRPTTKRASDQTEGLRIAGDGAVQMQTRSRRQAESKGRHDHLQGVCKTFPEVSGFYVACLGIETSIDTFSRCDSGLMIETTALEGEER